MYLPSDLLQRSRSSATLLGYTSALQRKNLYYDTEQAGRSPSAVCLKKQFTDVGAGYSNLQEAG